LISAGSVVGNNILEARTLKGSKVCKGAGLEVFWQLCSGAAAAMHIRDFLGGLVLFLLLAEASRNWMWVSQYGQTQIQEITEARIVEEFQEATDPLLCQSPEPKCKDGFKVKCEIGDHIGCDCNYIHICYANVSRCVRTNITHTDSCGF